jgi:hypothetical protein
MFAPLDHHTYTPLGFVYTHLPPDTIPNQKPNIPHTQPNQNTHTEPPHPYIPQPNHTDHANQFNLSISKPKLDFTSFNGDEPFNWLRQCEKYFALASVPMDTWVSLTTLHCHGAAQTWWILLRTPSAYDHWTQFCTLVTNRFSTHCAHSSLESFHHMKQTASVSEYIQKFEELMSFMQMDYLGFNEAYFVSSFIAGLRECIKHYLIPHCPQTLSDAYWKTKELEKGILVKKSLLHLPSSIIKPSPTYSLPLPPKPSTTPQTTSQPKAHIPP